jgi:trigger factor
MKVTKSKINGLEHEFKVTIPGNLITDRIKIRLAEYGRTAKISGFRPGKTPLSVLEKRYGQESHTEAIKEILQEASERIVKENHLRIMLEPKINVSSYNPGKDLECTITIEVIPDIAVPDINKIKLERLKVKVSDPQIKEALEQIARQHRRSKPIKENIASKVGDSVIIDFKGTMNGAEIKGGTASDFELVLGSGALIPGFDNQLLGVRAGDLKALNVRFPEDYEAKHLAGKNAVFDVIVKELREPIIVKVDEALAKDLGHKTLKEFRDDVKKRLEKEFEGRAFLHVKRAVLDQLSKNSSNFSVSPSIVGQEFEAIWGQFKKELSDKNETIKKGSKEELALKDQYHNIAERRVKLGLLLSEIGKSNKVEVTSKDLSQEMTYMATQQPGREQEVFDHYRNNPDALARLRAPIFEDKVIEFILKNAKVSEKEVSQDVFEKSIKSATGEDGS